MIIVRLSFQVFLLSTFLPCVFEKAEAQNADANGLVAVSLHVVGKGTVNELNHDVPGYFVIATVTNQQDTAIKFWIMSCSWATQNWISGNDSIYFHEPGCDINLPIDIHLRPHQAIQFYGVLAHSGAIPFSKKVKLGFRYFTNEGDLWPTPGRQTTLTKPTIYWSNEVDVKDNLFQYQID
jgi:hypothetical protein